MKLLFSILLLFTSLTAYAQAPYWQWAKAFHTHDGGASLINGNVVIDPISNDVYMAGPFINELSVDTFRVLSAGMHDIFLSRFDSGGNLLQLTSAGGASDEYGRLKIDDRGNIYFISTFVDSTILFGNRFYSRGNGDMILASLSNLSSARWIKSMGSERDDGPTDLDFDNEGNIYLCGYYGITSTATGVTSGSYGVFDTDTLRTAGNGNGIIAKFDTAGSILKVIQDSGSNNYGGGAFKGISISTVNKINTAGGYYPNSWLDTFAMPTALYGGTFTTQYDSSFNALWAKFAIGYMPISGIMGAGTNGADAIKTDRNGNSYIIGNNVNISMLFGSVYVPFLSDNGFIAKYSSSGSFLWAKVIGGFSGEEVRAIELDSAGNIYLDGYFWGDFVLNNDTLHSKGFSDIFVAKMDSDGNYIWAVAAGGTGYDEPNSIAINKDGKTIYVSGFFDSYNLAFGNDTISSIALTVNDRDVFIAKLSYKPVLPNNGVQERQKKDMIAVSPNPASKICTVQTGSGGYEWLSIISANGTVVKKEKIAAGEQHMQVDVSTLPAGSYIIKAEGPYGKSIQKLSVIH